MSIQITVEDVHAELLEFARHHRCELPTAGDTCVLGDQLGDGGFGTVHPVLSRNGAAPRVPLAIKLHEHDPATISVIDTLHTALRENKASWADSLLGVPFALIATRISGQPKLASVMLNLSSFGYDPLPLSGSELRQKANGIDERLDMARSYCFHAALLEELGYIHGDQNLQNLMVNYATADVQIIDFEMGAVLVDGDERPLNGGKKDEFVPIEVKGDGISEGGHPHTLAAERWSVGMLTTTIILALPPLFFLRSISAKVLDEYAASGLRWPAIDMDGPLFEPGSRAVYEQVRPNIEKLLPRGIAATFAAFCAAGSIGDRRPSAADWVDALDAVRQPPRFMATRISSLLALEGSEVTVNWETDNARAVESALLGQLDPSGETTVPIGGPTVITLTAVNRWGRTPWSSPVVRTVPLPRIESVPVPDFPGFAMSVAAPWPEFATAEHNPFPLPPPAEAAFQGVRKRSRLRRPAGPPVPGFPPVPDLLAAEFLGSVKIPPEWRLDSRRRGDR